MTLREAVDQYIDWKRAQGARFVSQAYALRRFCRSVGNSVACDGVADDQVAAFLAGAAPASGNRVFLHCTLAALLRPRDRAWHCHPLATACRRPQGTQLRIALHLLARRDAPSA